MFSPTSRMGFLNTIPHSNTNKRFSLLFFTFLTIHIEDLRSSSEIKYANSGSLWISHFLIPILKMADDRVFSFNNKWECVVDKCGSDILLWKCHAERFGVISGTLRWCFDRQSDSRRLRPVSLSSPEYFCNIWAQWTLFVSFSSLEKVAHQFPSTQ